MSFGRWCESSKPWSIDLAWSRVACRLAFQVFRARERFVGVIASLAFQHRRVSALDTSASPSSG
jgi:hypothetical protein